MAMHYELNGKGVAYAEALPEVWRIRHRAKNASPSRRVWISIDTIHGCFWSDLPAPPIRVGDKEHLLLGKGLKTW